MSDFNPKTGYDPVLGSKVRAMTQILVADLLANQRTAFHRDS